MKQKLHSLIVVALLAFSGCSSSSVSPYAKPAWTLHANVDGKTGAVGIAGRTFDLSPSSQRKLAIQRALDELSLQKKVRVTLDMSKSEHQHNESFSSDTRVESHYKTNNTITAHIEDMWRDPSTDELYVWMVLDE